MADKGTWREVARRRYWREDDARAVVTAWRRSGEARAPFCRAHGISMARLSRWAARLRAESEPAAFHPVRVSEVARGGSEALVVEIPGVVTIRLAPGFAVEDLRRVLSAFETEAC